MRLRITHVGLRTLKAWDKRSGPPPTVIKVLSNLRDDKWHDITELKGFDKLDYHVNLLKQYEYVNSDTGEELKV